MQRKGGRKKEISHEKKEGSHSKTRQVTMVIKIRMKLRKDAKERSQRVKKGRKMKKLEGRKQSMEGRKEGSRVRKEGR